MIAAIMQPYFFPYIGYFQLMHAADVFIFHDDAQYIKGGWVNRNRILVDNHINWLTLPIKSDSNFLPINQRHFLNEPSIIDKTKRRLVAAYAKTPAFTDSSATIFDLLAFADSNVAAFNCHALVTIATKLRLRCEFARSSTLAGLGALKGQDKVIALCKKFEADHYINPIGGVDLYDPVAFSDAGITLSFLQTAAPPTPTDAGPQHLSAIDGLMNRHFDGYADLLPRYTLLRKSDVQVRS